MTPGQTHPRRRGLNELMESVAAKLAERPDHIAAARVLEEMQADAAKISHKADDVDVQNGQSEVSSSSSSSSSSAAAAAGADRALRGLLRGGRDRPLRGF